MTIDKIKTPIKAAFAWMRADGINHNLACYSVFLALAPLIGTGWARGATIALAFAKEAIDVFVKKNNDWKEALHDLACDAIGILEAEMTVALWALC